MNYYPFHIGDYLSATRHLSWEEDAAYRRMLDVYYTTEKPLPAELRAVCRLVLATTEVQREAVRQVLEEFFEPTEAGWINRRADAEIDSMRVKQIAQEDKDRHESDRMRRYRERRAAMFSELRAVNVVPAWDVAMKELQRLFDQHCKPPVTPETPATDLKREQAVSGVTPATAISTNTNTNTNTSINTHTASASAPAGAVCATFPPMDDESDSAEDPGSIDALHESAGMRCTDAGAVCLAMKAAGIADVSPGNPKLRVLVEAGADLQEFVGAAQKAVKDKKGFAYALGIVSRSREQAAEMAAQVQRGELPKAAVKPTFAQAQADVARTTVPGREGRDPTLLRIEAEAAKAVAMPPEVRARIAALRGVA